MRRAADRAEALRNGGVMKAFGIEPNFEPYSLRQARYFELGVDVAERAQRHFARTGRPLELLDIGVWDGVSRRYIEAHTGGEHVIYSAADAYPHGEGFVYRHEDWIHHHCDLERGLLQLPSERYDVVICEQVLEHLHHFEPTLCDLERLTRPGGLVVVGVPIFPFGFHLVRRHAVPITDRLFRVKKKRGHVQAFSRTTILRALRRSCPQLSVERERGFRIISGGLLLFLEHYRWWWRFNRRLGALVPLLCTEIQILLTKQPARGSP
jgi:2-polyprenyl-3-methyl-5-hydroxy-6-metoxy-1,4-benzoquinol methylase